MSSTYVWLALPAIVMITGGLLTSVWHPGRALISLVQHLAAGIILAAVTLEVFPEMRAAHPAPTALVISFSLGVLFMYAIKLLGERLERGGNPQTARLNYGFIITVFLDAALDGLTIGAGFAAGQKVGFALALGLSLEMLFLGMSLISDTMKGRRLIVLSAGLSAALLLCAVLGFYFLSKVSTSTIAIVLAFSAAALLYLVTEELLVEAHVHKEQPYSMLILFTGFVGFWAISLL